MEYLKNPLSSIFYTSSSTQWRNGGKSGLLYVYSIFIQKYKLFVINFLHLPRPFKLWMYTKKYIFITLPNICEKKMYILHSNIYKFIFYLYKFQKNSIMMIICPNYHVRAINIHEYIEYTWIYMNILNTCNYFINDITAKSDQWLKHK